MNNQDITILNKLLIKIVDNGEATIQLGTSESKALINLVNDAKKRASSI
jgi:hypothetical protein